MSEAALAFRENFSDAAKGNLFAQRELVMASIEMAANIECVPFLAFYEATVWARMAAAHGDPVDQHLLAACLCHFGKICGEEGLGELASAQAAEALAILDKLADEGSEVSSECFHQLADNVPLQTLQLAKLLRETV